MSSAAAEILARLLQVDDAQQLDVLAAVVAVWVYRRDHPTSRVMAADATAARGDQR